MGKIYKVKDAKTGQTKYPVTVSDAVVIENSTLTEELNRIDELIGDVETLLTNIQTTLSAL